MNTASFRGGTGPFEQPRVLRMNSLRKTLEMQKALMCLRPRLSYACGVPPGRRAGQRVYKKPCVARIAEKPTIRAPHLVKKEFKMVQMCVAFINADRNNHGC